MMSAMLLIKSLKSYGSKINKNFRGDKVPKEGSRCVCMSVIVIDSVFKMGWNQYLTRQYFRRF